MKNNQKNISPSPVKRVPLLLLGLFAGIFGNFGSIFAAFEKDILPQRFNIDIKRLDAHISRLENTVSGAFDAKQGLKALQEEINKIEDKAGVVKMKADLNALQDELSKKEWVVYNAYANDYKAIQKSLNELFLSEEFIKLSKEFFTAKVKLLQKIKDSPALTLIKNKGKNISSAQEVYLKMLPDINTVKSKIATLEGQIPPKLLEEGTYKELSLVRNKIAKAQEGLTNILYSGLNEEQKIELEQTRHAIKRLKMFLKLLDPQEMMALTPDTINLF